MNPIVDTARKPSVEWVHVRNGEVAVFAVGVESLITDESVVCVAPYGPGNTYLAQGLYDSHHNDAKVLTLTSHVPPRQIGPNFFQEAYPELILNECSGCYEMVNSVEQGSVTLRYAIQLTMTGHNVSVLVLSGDTTTYEAENDEFVTSTISSGRPVVFPDAGQAAALTGVINETKIVTLFCDAGAKDARKQVFELAEKIKSLVGHVLGGKMYTQHDSPYDVGMSDLLGYDARHDVSSDVDLLTLSDTDFPYSGLLPTKNVAQVDIDGRAISRRTVVEHPVAGDVAAIIETILPRLDEKTDRPFLDGRLRNHERLFSHIIEAYTHDAENMRSVHPGYMADLTGKHADDDAAFTVDTGMDNVWATRYIVPSGKREQIGSFRHDTIANALSRAISVQTVDRDRQIITLNGSDDLSMLLGELIIMEQEQLPVKVFVFNNSSLGMVRLEMLVQGLPECQTDHGAVDYVRVVEPLGIKVVRIEDPAGTPRPIQEVLARDGSVLVDTITGPNVLSILANII